MAPDGSQYVVLTDGAGNLAPASGGSSSNPNGQATMANSAPVVIASNQSAVPVSQSGTWTVQPGNTANTTAWKVDGSAVTQPVSAASLPLPTGAATSAAQTTMGTNQTVVQAPVAPATATATKANLVGGQYNSTRPTFTDGQQGSMQLGSTGSLGVTLFPVNSGSGYGLTNNGADGTSNSVLGLNVGAFPFLYNGSTWDRARGDTNGAFTQGNVSSAVADAGKPVKVGGVYNSAVQAFTSGNRADLQVDQRGGLLVQDGQAIPSVSVTSATTLFTVSDTSGYGSISVQVTSAGSATVTYEVSEDGTTWNSASGTTPNNTGGSSMVTNSVAIGMFQFNLTAKQFRARVSSYSSGTITIQGTLKKDSVGRVSVAIGNNVSVIGTTTEAGAVQNGLQMLNEGRTTNKTAVTSGQAVRPIATSIGAAVNKPFQVPELDWTYAAAAGGITNTTTAVTIVAAAGAGIRNYLTGLQISNSTLGAGTELAIRDGAGGTVLWRGILATAASDPGAISFPSPLRGTANTLMEVVTLTASVTGAVYFNAQGYQAP